MLQLIYSSTGAVLSRTDNAFEVEPILNAYIEQAENNVTYHDFTVYDSDRSESLTAYTFIQGVYHDYS